MIHPPSFRMPDAMHLGRVRLQIADLRRSVEYYRDFLGFRLVEEAGDTARLAAYGSDEIIVELHEKRGSRSVPRRGLIGLYHFAILLPDRASLARFVNHLAAERARAGMSDHLVSEAIYLTDPDGLGIEVYADRPRDTWPMNGDELAMATEPLNVESLVAEAGSEPWAGMPAGTRIGHVHLHVGDLEATRAFYHEALGLDLVVWSYPGALFMSAGGYHHHLGTNTWAAGAPAATENDARLIDWQIIVPSASDAEGVAASLTSHRYAVERSKDERGVEWRATDPWGTAVRITSIAASS